ncbi:MAG: beta-ketoacyl synthase N-terminal-like domain-containing protein [Thermodesulfobacteriota bacterium]
MRIAVTGAGLIEDVDKGKMIDLSELPRQVRTFLRVEELCLYAAHKAIKDAELSIIKDPASIGIVLGVDEGIDDCKAQFFCGLLTDGPEGASPILFPFTSPNAITAQVSIAFGIQGENITIANGSLSSGKAIAYAMDILRLGKVRAVITGGVTHNCAVVTVLEDLEAATKRGVRIYGEITGYGESHTGGHVLAITQAIEDANLLKDDVDSLWINEDAGNIPGESWPIKRFDNNGAASSAMAVVTTLLTMNGKVKVVTVTGPHGGSSSLVITTEKEGTCLS